MDSQPGTIWGREPAMVLALVQAVIALVVAFGLNLAPDQIGAILAVTAVILGLITRSRVSPAPLVRDGYLRGSLPRTPTARQVDVLAAFVAAGGFRGGGRRARRRPAEHREAPPRRPAGALGPHDRAADLRWAS